MSKVEIIAELGINHNGDMQTVKQMIDVAYGAGCDYVKFQKRNIDLVYTPEELAAPRQSPWGTTQRQQKEGLELSNEQYDEIAKYCQSKPIKWFVSPWDEDSMRDFLGNANSPIIKIPSALITNKRLCRITTLTSKQVMISTGMSTLEEVDQAIEWIGKGKIHSILHCTSTYPSVPEEQNLRCITTLKERYPWAKIGFSNHSPGITFIPAAVALGAEVIEFHLTLSRASYGSDQAASIEPEGCHKIVKYVRALEKGLGDGIKRVYDSEIPIIRKLRR